MLFPLVYSILLAGSLQFGSAKAKLKAISQQDPFFCSLRLLFAMY